MSANPPPIIDSIDELLVHATAVETEAQERYEDLAGQMEMHNNPRVAKLFRAMAEVERKHVDRLSVLAKGHDLQSKNASDFNWPDLEAPESVPIGEGHYRMSEHEALDLAMECERRAGDFYASIAATTTSPEARTLAGLFAEEERKHQDLVQRWIDRLPPRKTLPADLDEPADQE
jgi:rubrerythrin